MLHSESVTFRLPLVIMEEKEYLIPAGNIDIDVESDAILDLKGSHFKYIGKKHVSFSSRWEKPYLAFVFFATYVTLEDVFNG